MSTGVATKPSIVYLALMVSCVLYFVYVNVTARSFEGSLTKVCENVNDPSNLLPSIDDDENREVGSKHSLSYLISNPLQIVRGSRVQRLDVFNQLLVGVRHFEIDLSLVPVDRVDPPVDSRLRTLFGSSVVPLIVTNNARTDYNLFDFVDSLNEYASFASSTAHLWIKRVYDADEIPLTEDDRRRVLDELKSYSYRIDPKQTRRLIVETGTTSTIVRWIENVEERLVRKGKTD